MFSILLWQLNLSDCVYQNICRPASAPKQTENASNVTDFHLLHHCNQRNLDLVSRLCPSQKYYSRGWFVCCVSTFLLQAEGLEQSFSASLLFEVSPSQSSLSREVMFSFPADVVEGSERVSVTAVGMQTHNPNEHRSRLRSPEADSGETTEQQSPSSVYFSTGSLNFWPHIIYSIHYIENKNYAITCL